MRNKHSAALYLRALRKGVDRNSPPKRIHHSRPPAWRTVKSPADTTSHTVSPGVSHRVTHRTSASPGAGRTAATTGCRCGSVVGTGLGTESAGDGRFRRSLPGTRPCKPGTRLQDTNAKTPKHAGPQAGLAQLGGVCVCTLRGAQKFKRIATYSKV